MGKQANLVAHSMARALSDLKAWFKDNQPVGVIGLVLTFFSILFAALVGDATMHDLRDALTCDLAARKRHAKTRFRVSIERNYLAHLAANKAHRAARNTAAFDDLIFGWWDTFGPVFYP